jgi:hypothetical protein
MFLKKQISSYEPFGYLKKIKVSYFKILNKACFQKMHYMNKCMLVLNFENLGCYTFHF